MSAPTQNYAASPATEAPAFADGKPWEGDPYWNLGSYSHLSSAKSTALALSAFPREYRPSNEELGAASASIRLVLVQVARTVFANPAMPPANALGSVVTRNALEILAEVIARRPFPSPKGKQPVKPASVATWVTDTFDDTIAAMRIAVMGVPNDSFGSNHYGVYDSDFPAFAFAFKEYTSGGPKPTLEAVKVEQQGQPQPVQQQQQQPEPQDQQQADDPRAVHPEQDPRAGREENQPVVQDPAPQVSEPVAGDAQPAPAPEPEPEPAKKATTRKRAASTRAKKAPSQPVETTPAVAAPAPTTTPEAADLQADNAQQVDLARQALEAQRAHNAAKIGGPGFGVPLTNEPTLPPQHEQY